MIQASSCWSLIKTTTSLMVCRMMIYRAYGFMRTYCSSAHGLSPSRASSFPVHISTTSADAKMSNSQSTSINGPPCYFLGRSNSCGFMLSLHSFATQPASCRYVCIPSRIRMCVKPISRMNSSLVCSESSGMVFVTLNMVLMMS